MKQPGLKNPAHAAGRLGILVAAFAMLACQAASRLVPTAAPPAATPTPTRAPTRIPKPTLTPTALPDISGIMLLETDLPKQFQTRELRSLDDAELKQLDMVREDFFLFKEDQTYQAVSGYRFLLKDALDRRLADEDIADQEKIKDYIAQWAGAEDIRESKPLNGFGAIGDTRMALTILYVVNRRQYRVEGVVFRRGGIYVLMIVDHSENNKPIVKLSDLAAIFDQRILENPAVAH